jgi:hypothetical protein
VQLGGRPSSRLAANNAPQRVYIHIQPIRSKCRPKPTHGRRPATELLTKKWMVRKPLSRDNLRRIAANVARLPELLPLRRVQSLTDGVSVRCCTGVDRLPCRARPWRTGARLHFISTMSRAGYRPPSCSPRMKRGGWRRISPSCRGCCGSHDRLSLCINFRAVTTLILIKLRARGVP